MLKEIAVNIDIFGQSKEVDTIFCSCKDKCGLYSNGKCLLIRSFLSHECPYGRVVTRAYRTTAKMSRDDKLREVRENPNYAKLQRATNIYAAVIGDYLWLNNPGVYIAKANEAEKQDGKMFAGTLYLGTVNEFGYVFTTEHSCCKDTFVELADVTPAFLNALLAVIKAANELSLTNIITDIRRSCPDLYAALAAEYPRWDNIESSFIGRTALLSTLADGCTITDSNG